MNDVCIGFSLIILPLRPKGFYQCIALIFQENFKMATSWRQVVQRYKLVYFFLSARLVSEAQKLQKTNVVVHNEIQLGLATCQDWAMISRIGMLRLPLKIGASYGFVSIEKTMCAAYLPSKIRGKILKY